MKLADMTDRQILIYLANKIHGLQSADERIEKRLDNHLKHTYGVIIALIGVLGAVAAALIAVASR